ncbi:MAG: hypothetical protein H6625_08190 [Bdellovibrionaceae bacterium]|nr:hypothetical protein [Pseudobdellovibrionaceae bacterium]
MSIKSFFSFIFFLFSIGCASQQTRFFFHNDNAIPTTKLKAIKQNNQNRKIANLNYPNEECSILPDTSRAIEMLSKTKDVKSVWPGFDLSKIRFVLTDGQFNNRSLLVHFNELDLKSVEVNAVKCTEHPDVYWADNRPIPKRKSDLITQCSTSKKDLNWADYRCDFFPELQQLFDITQKQIHFYEIPNIKYQYIIQEFTADLEENVSVDLVSSQANTIIHEYFHVFQVESGYHMNSEKVYGSMKKNYFKDCVEDNNWTKHLDAEKVKFKKIFKNYDQISDEELVASIKDILYLRHKDDQESSCWNSFRYYEKWEGIANYVSYSALLKAKSIKWEQIVDFSIMMNKRVESYYASGMYWGFILDRLTKSNTWKSKVQSGHFPDLLVQKFLDKSKKYSL